MFEIKTTKSFLKFNFYLFPVAPQSPATLEEANKMFGTFINCEIYPNQMEGGDKSKMKVIGKRPLPTAFRKFFHVNLFQDLNDLTSYMAAFFLQKKEVSVYTARI